MWENLRIQIIDFPLLSTLTEIGNSGEEEPLWKDDKCHCFGCIGIEVSGEFQKEISKGVGLRYGFRKACI